MFTLKDQKDEKWVRENLDIVSNCGFRIYEDETTNNIYLGLDNTGQDFIKQNWTPLYDARVTSQDIEDSKKYI